MSEDGGKSVRKSSVAAAAREKARRLKAEREAERLRVEKLIEDQAIAHAVARADEAQALSAVEAARAAQSAAIVELSRLGVADDEVAELCDLTVSEVRKVRRAEKKPATVRAAASSQKRSAGSGSSDAE